MNRYGHAITRCFERRLLAAMIIAAPLMTLFAMPTVAQRAPIHLNPAIAKLAAGQPMIGLENHDDLSLDHCRHLARVNFDYVYEDFEHGPMNMEALAVCAAVMSSDRETAIKNGNAALKVALFARFPPYGRDGDANDGLIKQALELGLMGLVFNGVDNAEQATRIVREMRYPQMKTSRYQQPPGLRGWAGGSPAPFTWGIDMDEYLQRADLWPLNPQGDLLAIMMVETLEGLKDIDQIASVPGVGAIFVGSGSDLSRYLGVPLKSPEVEAGFQKILASCKAHNVVCGITARAKEDIDKRLQEGWRMIRTVELPGATD